MICFISSFDECVFCLLLNFEIHTSRKSCQLFHSKSKMLLSCSVTVPAKCLYNTTHPGLCETKITSRLFRNFSTSASTTRYCIIVNNERTVTDHSLQPHVTSVTNYAHTPSLSHSPTPAGSERGGWIMQREKFVFLYRHRLSHQGCWPRLYLCESVSSLCSHTNTVSVVEIDNRFLTCRGCFSSSGEYPNKDLWDGKGSCSRSEVHWGVCSPYCGGIGWLQDCHREEHSPSASSWEHSTDIWCQHQTQPQPSSVYYHVHKTLIYCSVCFWHLFHAAASGAVQPRVSCRRHSSAGSKGARPRPDWWRWNSWRSKGNQSAVWCLRTLGPQSTNHHHQHVVIWAF